MKSKDAFVAPSPRSHGSSMPVKTSLQSCQVVPVIVKTATVNPILLFHRNLSKRT